MEALEFEFKPYGYEPLPTPSFIPLITLVKRTEHASQAPSLRGKSMLEAALRTVDLTDNLVYKALPYTLGLLQTEGRAKCSPSCPRLSILGSRK
jgi:hypothetical protein